MTMSESATDTTDGEPYSDPDEWEQFDPCPYCGGTHFGGIEHKGVSFDVTEGGRPHSFNSGSPLGVVTCWCAECGAALLEEGEIVAGDRDPQHVEVPREALESILEWTRSDPALDAIPDDADLIDDYNRLMRRLVGPLCEVCHHPARRAEAKLADGTALCWVHADEQHDEGATLYAPDGEHEIEWPPTVGDDD